MSCVKAATTESRDLIGKVTRGVRTGEWFLRLGEHPASRTLSNCGSRGLGPASLRRRARQTMCLLIK